MKEEVVKWNLEKVGRKRVSEIERKRVNEM